MPEGKDTQVPVPDTVATCPECGWTLAYQVHWLWYDALEQTDVHHSVHGWGVAQRGIGCFNYAAFPHAYPQAAWQRTWAIVSQWLNPVASVSGSASQGI